MCTLMFIWHLLHWKKKKKSFESNKNLLFHPKAPHLFDLFDRNDFHLFQLKQKLKETKIISFKQLRLAGGESNCLLIQTFFFFSVLIISIFSANEKRKRNRNRTTSWQNCVMGNGNGKFPHYRNRNRNRKSGWRNCSYSCWGIPIWEFLIHFCHHTVVLSFCSHFPIPVLFLSSQATM